MGTFVAMKKTCCSQWICNVAIQCIAPNIKPLLTMVRYIVRSPIFWHSQCSNQVTLQWPLDVSSMMQPEGRLVQREEEDESILSLIVSMETSAMAHFWELSCLQVLMKLTSFGGMVGVSIWSSANICNRVEPRHSWWRHRHCRRPP